MSYCVMGEVRVTGELLCDGGGEDTGELLCDGSQVNVMIREGESHR